MALKTPTPKIWPFYATSGVKPRFTVMKRSRLQDYADRAADWRHRAAKLRALAKATPQADARAELLDLAGQWDQLAEKAETRRPAGPVH